MMGDPETPTPEPVQTPTPEPAPAQEPDNDDEEDEKSATPSASQKILNALEIEEGSTSQTYDGETDPAFIIKMQNQKRVFEQSGRAWPPPEEPEQPEPQNVTAVT